MNRSFKLKAVSFFACAFLASSVAMAQTTPPAKKQIPSPRDSVSGMIGKATISINYGAPSLRGRKILGVIEPYGKVWRAGANAATTFTTDKDIMVEGQKLPAGKYSLYATPGETEWKIIFNSQTGQWGIKKNPDGPGAVATDDPAKDVLVITVKPKKAGPTERLTYTMNKKGFALVWEDVEVPVSIK
jgi:hypothetical protein